MGRQLVFWKYVDGVYLDNREVYMQSCAEGKPVTGLAELPVSEILAKVKKTFRGQLSFCFLSIERVLSE